MGKRLAVGIVAMVLLLGESGCLAAKIVGVMAAGFAVGMAVGETATFAGYTFGCPGPWSAKEVAQGVAVKLRVNLDDTVSRDGAWYLHSADGGPHHVLVEGGKGGTCRASVLIDGHSLGPGILGRTHVPAGAEDRIPEVVEARNAIEQELHERGVAWTYARWEIWHMPN